MPTLPGWDGEMAKDDMKIWRDRIEAAVRVRKKAGSENWKKYVDIYAGLQQSIAGLPEPFQRVMINLCKPTISMIRAATYFQNPRVVVEPAGPDAFIKVRNEIRSAEEQARLIETIDNALLPKTGAKKEIKRAIVDAHCMPLGIVKVSHETTTVSDTEGIEKVSGEKYVIRRVSPLRMYFDPSADAFDLDRCSWVAEKKYLSKTNVESAVDSKLYNAKAAKELQYQATAFVDDNERLEPTNSDTIPGVNDKAIIYECHDLESGRLVEFGDGATRPLRDDDHPYDVDGYIYEILGFDEVPDRFYPSIYIEGLAGIQAMINKLLGYFIRHVGRYSARKAIYNRNVIQDETAAMLIDSPDGVPTPVDVPIGTQLGEAWFNIPDNPIIADAFRIFEILMGPLWREVSRIDDMMRGAAPAGASPTEASMIRQGTSLGLSERRDLVETFTKGIIHTLNGELRQFQTTPEAVQMAGPVGAYWVQWDKEDIRQNFTERVEVYSTAPFDLNLERKQAIDLANFLYGRPETDNVVLLEEIRKKFGLSERVIRKATSQGPLNPDYENMMATQGQPLRVHPAEDHADHRRKHMAFRAAYQAWLSPEMQASLASHEQQHAMMEANIGAPQANVGTVGAPSQVPFQNAGAAPGAPTPQQQAQINPTPAQVLAAQQGGVIQ